MSALDECYDNEELVSMLYAVLAILQSNPVPKLEKALEFIQRAESIDLQPDSSLYSSKFYCLLGLKRTSEAKLALVQLQEATEKITTLSAADKKYVEANCQRLSALLRSIETMLEKHEILRTLVNQESGPFGEALMNREDLVAFLKSQVFIPQPDEDKIQVRMKMIDMIHVLVYLMTINTPHLLESGAILADFYSIMVAVPEYGDLIQNSYIAAWFITKTIKQAQEITSKEFVAYVKTLVTDCNTKNLSIHDEFIAKCINK